MSGGFQQHDLFHLHAAGRRIGDCWHHRWLDYWRCGPCIDHPLAGRPIAGRGANGSLPLPPDPGGGIRIADNIGIRIVAAGKGKQLARRDAVSRPAESGNGTTRPQNGHSPVTLRHCSGWFGGIDRRSTPCRPGFLWWGGWHPVGLSRRSQWGNDLGQAFATRAQYPHRFGGRKSASTRRADSQCCRFVGPGPDRPDRRCNDRRESVQTGFRNLPGGSARILFHRYSAGSD